MAPRFRPARIRSLYYGGDNGPHESSVSGPGSRHHYRPEDACVCLAGAECHMQATGTATTGIPAGTVTFEDGSTTLGSAPLLDGKRKHLA